MKTSPSHVLQHEGSQPITTDTVKKVPMFHPGHQNYGAVEEQRQLFQVLIIGKI